MNPEWETTISGYEFDNLTHCFVYGWFRNDECLYIGRATRGLRRFETHAVIGVIDKVLPNDEFRIIPRATMTDARELEFKLIEKYKPKYNSSLDPLTIHKIVRKLKISYHIC